MSPGGRRPRSAARRRPARVAVVLHHERRGIARRLDPVLRRLARRAAFTTHEASEAPTFRRRTARPDLVLAIGGDGTILAGARAVAGTPVPLLGVNVGGLGFLAAAEGRDLGPALEAALAGRCEVHPRRTLEVEVRERSGERRAVGLAVNDAVLRQGDAQRALRAELSLDGRPLGTLLADGLVVATSTGSTAYSLSAGGPLMLDETGAAVATPVCPHTLSSRPLVFSDGHVLSARITRARGAGAGLSLDGTPGFDVAGGDEVRFVLGRARVRFLRLPDHDSVRALRTKLGWEGTTRKRSP